jgi:hypothetical protein
MLYLTFVYFGYILVYFNAIPFSQVVSIFKISLPTDIAEGVYSGIPGLGACIGSLGAKFFI